jgi:hypothetical protein
MKNENTFLLYLEYVVKYAKKMNNLLLNIVIYIEGRIEHLFKNIKYYDFKTNQNSDVQCTRRL